MSTDVYPCKSFNAPIGFFDSGIGGLTLLAEAKRLLPSERFIYVADTAFMPYGLQSGAQITARAAAITEYFRLAGCKVVVIACNTATAVAAQSLRRLFDIPIIGIEPAVKPALLHARGANVVMLATPATVRSRCYIPIISNLKAVACWELAGFIEHNYENTGLMEDYVAMLLKSDIFTDAGAIVLGCTHYVIVEKLFIKFLPNGTAVFDGNQGTAARLVKIIADNNIYSMDFSYKRDKIILTDPSTCKSKYQKIYRSLVSGSVYPKVCYEKI